MPGPEDEENGAMPDRDRITEAEVDGVVIAEAPGIGTTVEVTAESGGIHRNEYATRISDRRTNASEALMGGKKKC